MQGLRWRDANRIAVPAFLRFCFHRGVPFTAFGAKAFDGQPLMRYSIRYQPGHATLDPSSADPAVSKYGFGGRTLSSLGWRYPVCWPYALASEEEEIIRSGGEMKLA